MRLELGDELGDAQHGVIIESVDADGVHGVEPTAQLFEGLDGATEEFGFVDLAVGHTDGALHEAPAEIKTFFAVFVAVGRTRLADVVGDGKVEFFGVMEEIWTDDFGLEDLVDLVGFVLFNISKDFYLVVGEKFVEMNDDDIFFLEDGFTIDALELADELGDVFDAADTGLAGTVVIMVITKIGNVTIDTLGVFVAVV